jgi:exodeoxyribonuclease-3
MKIITWNVNGLRSVLSKDVHGKKIERDDIETKNVLETLISNEKPDIVALQETRCPDCLHLQLKPEFMSNMKFAKIIASKTRKGYSGVAVFSIIEPIRVLDDFPENEEGRVICLEFKNWYFINAYVPNSKPDLSRLQYRVDVWEKKMREYITTLQKHKPVIYVGDMNVAPTELDIWNAKANEKSHGYTIEERSAFSQMLKECDMLDSYRIIHPTERVYTWYSNFAKSRENNKGWFIDKAVISAKLKKLVVDTQVLSTYFGSDHVPLLLELKS